MKKILTCFLALALLITLTACGGTQQPSTPSSQAQATASPTPTPTPAPGSSAVESNVSTPTPAATEEPAPTEESTTKKALVVYFSWSGNTEAVANSIAQQTGADIFKIEPETPYTDDYDTLLDIAQEEQRNDARPAFSGSIEGFEQYSVVYLGYPNWWGDMPMILYSFLDDYDLTGKTVAPFVTSGGSGFSNTISAIESAEPNATIVDGLSLGSSEARTPDDAVAEWLSSLGELG